MNARFDVWDDSREAIAALFPLDLSGEVVALRACIDAGTSKAGTLSVAGVAFGYGRAVKANAEWNRLLKGRTFHMTDLHNRKEDFEGIDDEEVEKIMRGVVAIIRKHASHVVAVSCDLNLLTEKFSKISNDDYGRFLERAFRSPYTVMLHLCMWGMGRFANNHSKGRREISYVLESGDEGQLAFINYVQWLMTQPMHGDQLNHYSLSRLTTAPKDQIEGVFHSADFVAWEWARQVERQKQTLPMRKSFSIVTEQGRSNPDYFGLTLSDRQKNFFRHYDERHANRWVRFAREGLGAKTSSQFEEAVSHWERTR